MLPFCTNILYCKLGLTFNLVIKLDVVVVVVVFVIGIKLKLVSLVSHVNQPRLKIVEQFSERL